ncbi:hypothetical protein ND2E_2234 [Colwellia psychrerythraea]|uniref:Uncharacterized protein n=1 Tax=Colwellia psychrerythraea TaxID=28229 RepID=A0A099KT87_COLPS|nr:hypothetical protein ND2E_2234 [Colwellia psychrerythraea]
MANSYRLMSAKRTEKPLAVVIYMLFLMLLDSRNVVEVLGSRISYNLEYNYR